MSKLKYPATLNCIICGKTAVGHAGHVTAKQQMVLGNLYAYNHLKQGGILVSVVSVSPFFRTNKKVC